MNATEWILDSGQWAIADALRRAPHGNFERVAAGRSNRCRSVFAPRLSSAAGSNKGATSGSGDLFSDRDSDAQ